MQTKISSQKEFDSIKSKFAYGEYRGFIESYRFNEWCRLKRTRLGIDVAWPGEMTKRTQIMAGMQTGLTVGLLNGQAQAISNGAKKDADIFMALKKGYIELESPRPR